MYSQQRANYFQAISSLSALSGEEIINSASSDLGINMNNALSLISSSRLVLDASGFDQETLLRRLTIKWTPDLALKNCESNIFFQLPG